MWHYRYSDNQKQLGPFILARASGGYYPWGLTITGKNADDYGESRFTVLSLHLWLFTLVVLLPPFLLGKCYGIRGSGDSMSLYFGKYDPMGDKGDSKYVRFHWMGWTFIRHTLLTPDLKYFREITNLKWEDSRVFNDTVPKVYFKLKDYDNTDVVATCKVEEREWSFGEGRWRWLRYFRKNMVRRSLDISFNAETGPEKGSWKGGTTGTGISMENYETPRQALRRYCDDRHRSKSGHYMLRFMGDLTDADLLNFLLEEANKEDQRQKKMAENTAASAAKASA